MGENDKIVQKKRKNSREREHVIVSFLRRSPGRHWIAEVARECHVHPTKTRVILAALEARRLVVTDRGLVEWTGPKLQREQKGGGEDGGVSPLRT